MANIVANKAVGEVDVRFKTIAEAEKSIADVQRIVATNYVPHTKTTVTGNVIKFMPFETTPAVQKLYEHYASHDGCADLVRCWPLWCRCPQRQRVYRGSDTDRTGFADGQLHYGFRQAVNI